MIRITFRSAFLLVAALLAGGVAVSQSNSGSIDGTVKDQSGAAVSGAAVEISYPVSGYSRTTKTGSEGEFRFSNIPFNRYHLAVSAAGFASYTEDVDVRSAVPASVVITMKILSAETSVQVEASGNDLTEMDPNFHTDVDRNIFDKLPLESQSSSVSSLVTLATPGVVADSNGLFHGLGDHAENSFSVDGQPITDQQSKVFSNQIPVDSIQSLEVMSGAPPAEFGDKTSLVIKVTTRSGLGVTRPTGSVFGSYGSFGSVTGGFNTAIGGQKWGNFISASGLNTGRFLDPPEFQILHAKGNEENLFDRVDFQLRSADTIHLNLGFIRSWFQTPNSFDALFNSQNPGLPVLTQDERSQIRTFNVAPTWTHLAGSATLFTVGGYVRQDRYGYYPSANPLADLTATISQQRRLTNAGLRADVSHVKGHHNVKAGVNFSHTFLNENFSVGLTDPAANSPCIDPASNNAPVGDPALADPSQCGDNGFQFNPAYAPLLRCFDLSRPTPSPTGLPCAAGPTTSFPFRGHADIKEVGLYLQDAITTGNWAFNLGIRGDLYRGIVSDSQAEPRVGIAYNIKKTNTVFRVSYARVMETPFNENLVVASQTNANSVIGGIVGGDALAPIRPGQRNEFHAGFQQAFGRYLVIDADYLWKYTRNGYDFSVLLGTPITFPIAWHNSKIDGASVRVSVPNFHRFTAFAVFGHAKARFFFPQVGGLGASQVLGPVFRIDHDQVFQQTTHVQYQWGKSWPWIGFNWRYDSGLVSSNPGVLDFPTALASLDGDQQAAIGLFCGNLAATLTNPLTASRCGGKTPFGARLLDLAAPGTNNPDHNPTRVRPRHLFDLSVGDDNLFHGDRYKWSLRLTVINLTNKVTLYNFLSTFSGTHFVTPRAYNLELGFHF